MLLYQTAWQNAQHTRPRIKIRVSFLVHNKPDNHDIDWPMVIKKRMRFDENGGDKGVGKVGKDKKKRCELS